MAKLADALDLGSSPARGGGSSPFSCTIKKRSSISMVHSENNNQSNLVLTLNQRDNQHFQASITIAQPFVETMYKKALISQQEQASTYGFSKGTTPLTYVEYAFKPNIIEHLKEFFFNHCVFNFLGKELIRHKFVVAGDPKLVDIVINPPHEACFVFDLIHVTPVIKNEWKKLNFKAPERKNYKDLDRQVEAFIKEEHENSTRIVTDTIKLGDWVCFDLRLIDSEGKPLLENHINKLWIKMSDEEADQDVHELFLNKKIGDRFFTTNNFLQYYISDSLDTQYAFEIHIVGCVPHIFFSLEQFKRHFKLKSTKETHLKLIEVFSYRNDLSQRRETIEATLKLLLNHHPINVPEDLIVRQQKLVLDAVHINPDYHVYKSQHDFKEKVRKLAEKQLKEKVFIDYVSYQENITTDDDDMISYINLLKRPRTKEFIYFDLPPTKVNGQETPIAQEILQQFCLREKTLNHIIYYLTKR